MALAAWTNGLALGLDLEVKRTSKKVFWSWVNLEVIKAVIAKTGQVIAGFEAKLVAIALERESS